MEIEEDNDRIARRLARDRVARDRQDREISVACGVLQALDAAGVKWDDVKATQVNELAYRVNVYLEETSQAERVVFRKARIAASYYVIVDEAQRITRALPALPKALASSTI